MSLRNFFKKKGKRLAGVWGRINHKRDMRAASKGIRRYPTDQETYNLFTEAWEYMNRPTVTELMECDETPECLHPSPEYYSSIPERPDEPGCPGGLYCPDCETWLEEPDEATKLGI